MHRLPLSYSRLARFARCERLFLMEDSHAPTPAQVLGSASHKLALEGQAAFDAAYCLPPVNPKTGTFFGLDTQASASHALAQGKVCLSDSMMSDIKAMSEALARHELAQGLLSGCITEQEIDGVTIDGLACHGRVDAFSDTKQILIELKTCADLDSMYRDIERYRYDRQLAFYRELIASKFTIDKEDISCFIIAVEKQELYRVGVFKVSGYALRMAMQANSEAVHRLKRCMETGIFSTGYENMKIFEGRMI